MESNNVLACSTYCGASDVSSSLARGGAMHADFRLGLLDQAQVGQSTDGTKDGFGVSAGDARRALSHGWTSSRVSARGKAIGSVTSGCRIRMVRDSGGEASGADLVERLD
ncbi:hypothetical protein AB0J20_30655 [Micromonospora costi]|uniref:hypothetical protein n=1 Tax=Micromonospora costi TaxID=1530042 RepID=UPI0033C104C0